MSNIERSSITRIDNVNNKYTNENFKNASQANKTKRGRTFTCCLVPINTIN